jgi:hypothetical protein
MQRIAVIPSLSVLTLSGHLPFRITRSGSGERSVTL